LIHFSHDVSQAFYRDPLGAVACGSTLRLRVAVEEKAEVASLRLFYVYGLPPVRESFFPMRQISKNECHSVYECSLQMDHEPGLFYYWFEAQLLDGRYRWGFPDEDTRGVTAKTSVVSPDFKVDGTELIPAFQVTVHQEDFKTPDWMKGALLYQIFPDRFSRGKDFDGEYARSLMHYPERIWHENWDEEVDFEGKEPTGYEACDFFGGTLNGIREYLTELSLKGINVLYLNPVFQSKSNHRYDTGDYLKVDPLLGTNEDLIALFAEAKALGIHVILDGVFSHTGADSLYFNRFGRYDSVGAWQAVCEGADSDYTSWYRFSHEMQDAMDGPRYECWWDFPELPNVEEDDLSYREFISGKDGVLAYWLRQGCSGFRLDVSDELPDSFLRLLRARVKTESEDALVMGEVWEEPTAKISYGAYRDFLFGNTHDCVMGYPFRRDVIAFLTDEIDARELGFAFEKMLSITPKEALYTQMNLLGSHDTERIVTKLSGKPKPDDRKEQAIARLTDEERAKGEELLLAASLLQLAFPGATSVYYGDEFAMEGYDDPFNRRTFPREEDRPKSEMTTHLWELVRLKHEAKVLRTGFFEIIEAHDDRLIMRRYFDEEGRDAFGHLSDGPSEAIITVCRSPVPSGAVFFGDARVFYF